MSWGKLVGEVAKKAASKYWKERSVDGMIQDLGLVTSYAKKGFTKVSGLLSADTNDDGEIDDDEMTNWLNSFIPEMEACLNEAKLQDVLSKEFETNIQYILNTGYSACLELIEADEDMVFVGQHIDRIDSICDRAIDLVYKKCRGGEKNHISPKYKNAPFSFDVKGIYPVNFTYDRTILTGTIMSGNISKDDIIKLPTGESASVNSIKMFGTTVSKAEFGDICAIVLEGNFYEDLEENTPFVIGEVPTNSNKNVTEDNSDKQEQEYVSELKACLEDDGMISDRERRLLNRLRQSLGISEERAKQLELSIHTSNTLSPEEQEYADEVKACLEDDGEISSKERRLLAKLRDSLGIQPERAKEIEANLMK